MENCCNNKNYYTTVLFYSILKKLCNHEILVFMRQVCEMTFEYKGSNYLLKTFRCLSYWSSIQMRCFEIFVAAISLKYLSVRF